MARWLSSCCWLDCWPVCLLSKETDSGSPLVTPNVISRSIEARWSKWISISFSDNLASKSRILWNEVKYWNHLRSNHRIFHNIYLISILAISRWAAGSVWPFPFDSTEVETKRCRGSPLHRRRYCTKKTNLKTVWIKKLKKLFDSNLVFKSIDVLLSATESRFENFNVRSLLLQRCLLSAQFDILPLLIGHQFLVCRMI